MRKNVRFFASLLALLALLSAGCGACAGHEQKVLCFAVAQDEPAVTDRLLHTALSRIGYDVTIDATSMTAAIQMTDIGETDGLVAQVEGLEKSYANLVRVPESIGRVKYEVYALNNAPYTANSWNDLRGLRVATLAYKLYIENKLPQKTPAHLKKRTFFELVEALEAGECDAFVVANALETDMPVPPDVKKVGLLESRETFPYLNDHHAPFAPKLAKSLRDMKADGTFARIARRSGDPESESRTVLLITSYSPDDAWEKLLREGILGALSARGNVFCHSIALNSNRILNDEGRVQSVFDAIRTTCMSNPPDVVIATDTSALTFASNYYYILFGNVPIILSGTRCDSLTELWKFAGNCAPLPNKVPVADNVRQIFNLYPKTRDLFVINDYTEEGREWRRQIDEQLVPFAGSFDVHHNEDLPLDALVSFLGKLSEGAAVLFGHYNVDGKRVYYPQQDIQAQVRQSCRAPIFGMMGGSIGYGHVGGRYVDPALTGRAAAELALRILNAAHESSDVPAWNTAPPPDADSLNTWIFDENELRRQTIDLKRLPTGATVINRHLSLRETNPELFILLCALFFLTSVIIGTLSLLVNTLKRSNKKLMEIQKNLFTAEELLSKDREIREIKERFEIALSASSSGVWEIDCERKVVTYDQIAEQMFQGDPGGKMTLEEFEEMMTARAVGFQDSKFYQDMLCGDIGGRNASKELSVVWNDGTEHHLTSHFKTIGDSDGRASRIIGMVSDNTSRVKMANDLLVAKEAAEAANQAKSRFLSTMSHEIRTPMNAIIGMSELLLTENLTERQLKYVNDIKVSSTSLLGIINDILDISKIDSGKFKLTPVNYDFNELLSNLHTMFTFAAQAKGIAFLLDAEEELPRYLFGDDVRLRQILVNVIGNGIKFTDSGHVLLEITSCDGVLCFDIFDTGIGIKKENLDRLFNSFDQFDQDKTRKLAGTGLGLSITKSLVDMMDGSISVESEYGRGSRFHIEIPLVPGDEHKLAEHSPEASFIVSPTAKILVVDDNEINLNVAVGMMRLHKIDCDRATSGVEALQRARETSYDLIFMDHMMPEMDGVEATHALRENERAEACEEVPVIALTANAVEGVRDMLLASGMNDYLSKPIQDAALNEILAKWLPKKKIIQVAGAYNEIKSDAARLSLISRLGSVEEIDLELGLGRINGMFDVYEQSLDIMVRKLPETINNLSKFLEERQMRNFSILIHGTKGSLDNIGATELARAAQVLETHSKNDDITFCEEHTGPFLARLKELHQKLHTILSEENDPHKAPKEPGSVEALKKRLLVVKTLLESFLDTEAADLVKAIQKFDYGPEINLKLKDLLNAILEFNYDGAAELIDSMEI